MDEEQNQLPQEGDIQPIVDLGSSLIRTDQGTIYVLTIVGQIEGHQLLPPTSKSTKYEHVLPLLATIEGSTEIDGLLILLNNGGGDVEAGLAISEVIASMSKPTVSLVLGGSPVRLNGLVIGVPQTFYYFERIQERILQFVTANSHIKREAFTKLMLQTGELAADVGSVIYGEEAVELGLIDRIGGLSDALACLYGMIAEKKSVLSEKPDNLED